MTERSERISALEADAETVRAAINRWNFACRYCSDLPALDPNRCKPPTMRDELREALR